LPIVLPFNPCNASSAFFWQKGEEQFIRCHEGNRVHYKDGIWELKCGKYVVCGDSYL